MGGSVSSGASGAQTSAAGSQKATQNYAEVKPTETKVDGNGNVGLGVNATHILQFPRQPKRDDGKWVAIGSLLGALIGKIASSSIIKKAREAEDKWREANDIIFSKGKELLGKAPPEWDKMLNAETEVENLSDWNQNGRDNELSYAYSLDNCNDDIHSKLCAYVNCGYKPDYYGIATRVIASAEAAAQKECRELKKSLNRYASKGCCDIGIRLATAKVMSVVGTVSKLREDERRKQWEINSELLFKGAELFEKHRQGRITDAMAFAKEQGDYQKWLYEKRNYNYLKLTEMGGEFLASAGKNYGWLADSLRKTSEKDTSGLANLGAMIAVVAAMFFCDQGGFCGKEDSCGGGSSGEVNSQNAREQGGHNSVLADDVGSAI